MNGLADQAFADKLGAMSRRGYPFLFALSLWMGMLPVGGLRAQVMADHTKAGNTGASDSEAEAKRWFAEGRAALDVGGFEVALHAFERAYDLSGHAELLFNIGTVLDRLRRDADAARSFERYLELLPDAPNRLAVEARLSVLRAAVAAQDRAPAQVPSAAEVARRQVAADGPTPPQLIAGSAPTPRNDLTVPLRKKWWFWTAAALVAGGGATAAVLLIRHGDPKEQPPILGSQGALAQALFLR